MLTDRSHGGGSIHDGQVELMVNLLFLYVSFVMKGVMFSSGTIMN